MVTFHSLLVMKKQPITKLIGASKYSKPIYEAHIPRYDKAMRQGRGDRANKSDWQLVNGQYMLIHNYQFAYVSCIAIIV